MTESEPRSALRKVRGFLGRRVRSVRRALAGPPVEEPLVPERLPLPAHLVALADGEPAGRVADFGGPQVLPAAELAHAWRAARRLRAPVVRVRFPGRVAAAGTPAARARARRIQTLVLAVMAVLALAAAVVVLLLTLGVLGPAPQLTPAPPDPGTGQAGSGP